MHALCSVVIVIVSTGMFVQSPPPPCPADRPVDDIIAEIHKQQSSKKHRNADPLPRSICIFGWCRGASKTPPTNSGPARQGNASSENTTSTSTTGGNTPVGKCDAAMELALEAAHDVDVGDYYFEQKKYNAAMLRYNDALEEKPGDTAIHVRSGRTLEKLHQLPQAIEQYKAALKLTGPPKWVDEANSSLLRLQRPAGQ
jgi:tetratricopeptide (TPR) repeat protein